MAVTACIACGRLIDARFLRCGPCLEQRRVHAGQQGIRVRAPKNPLRKPAARRPARPKIPEATRIAVLERDQYRCQWCGEPARHNDQLTMDHLVPYAEGGTDDEDNLVAAHRSCNSRRGAKYRWQRHAEGR